mmetsp:Transcript_11950/g.17558  ORF Transcript_11950/g.17558 Transcript_11950/m.17558 type:complete len:80 (+) Transcript_11950:621-860(+)
MNGMLLEKSLHVAFDAFRWCMDDTGKIHVSNDAAGDNKDLAKWEGKETKLRSGEAKYPSKKLLSVRYELYRQRNNRTMA